jgi:putative transposase
MPFWCCYYHIVWATKGREPLISPTVEYILFDAVRQKSEALGSTILAMNSVTDHVHVAVSMPPTLNIADWMKHVKGASSHNINESQLHDLARFRWQGGYGVITVGPQGLKLVQDYITRQKEHHAQGTIYQSLEYTGNRPEIED